MNLVLSAPEFAINGIAYDGFPVLVDSDGRIVEIALLYCLYACIERGRMPARKSWATLGQHLYDYFGFLEGHHLAWGEPARSPPSWPIAIGRFVR